MKALTERDLMAPIRAMVANYEKSRQTRTKKRLNTNDNDHTPREILSFLRTAGENPRCVQNVKCTSKDRFPLKIDQIKFINAVMHESLVSRRLQAFKEMATSVESRLVFRALFWRIFTQFFQEDFDFDIYSADLVNFTTMELRMKIQMKSNKILDDFMAAYPFVIAEGIFLALICNFPGTFALKSAEIRDRICAEVITVLTAINPSKVHLELRRQHYFPDGTDVPPLEKDAGLDGEKDEKQKSHNEKRFLNKLPIFKELERESGREPTFRSYERFDLKKGNPLLRAYLQKEGPQPGGHYYIRHVTSMEDVNSEEKAAMIERIESTRKSNSDAYRALKKNLGGEHRK